MRLPISCIISISLLALALLASQALWAIAWDEEDTFIPIGKTWRMYHDDTRAMDLADVRQMDDDAFVPCPEEYYTSDFADVIYWFTAPLVIDDSGLSTLLLEVNNPHINHIRVYMMTRDSLVWDSGWHGDHFPFDRRAIKHRDFVFSLPVLLHVPYQLYMQIDMDGEVLMLDTRLWRAESYYAAQSQEDMFFGVLFGVMVALVLIAIAIWNANRGMTTAYYVGYTCSMFMLVMGYSGYGFQVLYGSLPLLHNISRPLFLGLSAVLFTLFAYYYLDIGTTYKRCSRAIWSIILVVVTLMVQLPFYRHYSFSLLSVLIALYFSANAVLFLMVFLWGLLAYIRLRKLEGLLFVIAYGVLACSILINVLVIQNIISASFLTQHIFYLAAVGEVLFMTIFMSYTFIRIRDNNQKLKLTISELRIENLQRLIEGEERERRRMAAELHDNIGYQLSHLAVGIKRFFSTHKSTTVRPDFVADVVSVGESIRLLSHDLYPPALKRFGLLEAIEDDLEQLARNYPDIAFGFVTNNEYQFSDMATLHLYRAYQESIKNAIQHGQANRINVRIVEDESEVVIMIQDDGRGFDPELTTGAGLGTQNLQNRMDVLNGAVEINSSPGNGCMVILTIPKSN